jgi:outer membrane protein assembly factor BamB
MVEDLDRRRGDPDVVGPYTLLGRLGSGGFGTVYAGRPTARADPLRLDDLVAVKVAHPQLVDLPDFQRRFAGEIRAVKRIRCDFVPQLVEAGSSDVPPWMATNLIPGLALDKLVRNCGPLPERAVWHLAAAFAEILGSIHAHEVVHRDIKPQNVLMVQDGPWIIDFSLVHLAELDHRTSSQVAMATYKYAAPEQLNALREASYPADVYALGATVLFAATGHPPYDGVAAPQVIRRVQTERPDLSGLPRGLYNLVSNCLLRTEGDRPTLDQVLAETDRRTGGIRRKGFSAALPPDMRALLAACYAEVAALTGEITPVPAVPLDVPEESGWGAGLGGDARQPPSVIRPLPVLERTAPPPTRAAPLLWSRRLGDWASAPPVVDGDLLVATCLDGSVTCLLTADGMPPSEHWDKSAYLGAAIHAAALLSPHGGASGTAYVGTAAGRVHALDLATRTSRVVVEAGAPIEGGLVAVRDRVFAVSADGRVHAIDPFSGARQVLADLGRPVTGSPAVTSDGRIVISDTAGVVHALDAGDGRPSWQARTDGLVLAAPVQSGTRLYIGGTDRVLRELGVADGREHARDTLPAPIHATPVAAGGTLYVAAADGTVRAYDTTHQGRIRIPRLWERSLGEEISGLATAMGRLFATVGCRVVEIDPVSEDRDRELRRLDCLIAAPPVLADGNCYITGLGGVIEGLSVI